VHEGLASIPGGKKEVREGWREKGREIGRKRKFDYRVDTDEFNHSKPSREVTNLTCMGKQEEEYLQANVRGSLIYGLEITFLAHECL
jgi:hypothetical protein